MSEGLLRVQRRGQIRSETLVTRVRKHWPYPVLVGIPAIGLAVVLIVGSRTLVAGPATATDLAPAARPALNATLRIPVFLAQLVAVIAVSRTLGRILRYFGQPQVVGEMLAGILLGPSVLGLIAPSAYEMLFPAGTVRFLNALSQVGLVLFMFLVGLDLDAGHLRGRGRLALLTSHASIMMPMFLGASLAVLLYPAYSTSSVSFITFALFVGTAMSVTAFPVLARLLAERGLERTQFGTLAIACAAIDDVTAWCMLGAITTFAADAGVVDLALSLGALALYMIAMFTVVRRGLRWIIDRAQRDGKIGQDALAVLVAVALASAWTTDRLGVHALFGAFIAGVVMPKDELLVQSVRGRFEDLLYVLLLPVFFVATGIRTNLGLLGGSLGILALTVLVAVAGKLLGSAIAARAGGMTWRNGFALGSLLNARGLVGLVVISVGLEAGVISSTIYTMLIITALLTTFMASPMLSAFHPRAAEAVA